MDGDEILFGLPSDGHVHLMECIRWDLYGNPANRLKMELEVDASHDPMEKASLAFHPTTYSTTYSIRKTTPK